MEPQEFTIHDLCELILSNPNDADVCMDLLYPREETFEELLVDQLLNEEN